MNHLFRWISGATRIPLLLMVFQRWWLATIWSKSLLGTTMSGAIPAALLISPTLLHKKVCRDLSGACGARINFFVAIADYGLSQNIQDSVNGDGTPVGPDLSACLEVL